MDCAYKSFIFAVVTFTFFTFLPCAASDTSAIQAEAELKQVALFKNGLVFFITQVTCPENKDLFSFIPVAAPCHGTFWLSYLPKVKLKSITAKKTESEESIEAVAIPELLKANVGCKVKLSFFDEEKEGVIKYFAEDRRELIPDPYAPGRIEVVAATHRGWDSLRSHLMIIETEDKEIVIDPQNVKKIEFFDEKAKRAFTSKRSSMQLEVQVVAPAGGEKLTVSYLAKGINWAPSYMVDITKVDKARISAKAVIINEACDLNSATVQLVTGFPHLQFADVVSPLALKEDLAQFLQSLIRGESERGRRDQEAYLMLQQRAAYEPRRGGMMMPAYGAAEAGKVAEDLFLYPVEKVQLKKGEVGYFPLFSESVPYKHIYQWKIPDYIDEQERYYYDRRRGEEREPEEEVVWHCLRLENTTKVPWTTAPAETVKEGLILGQDTLNYTPVHGETTLRITQALNVKAEQLELETDRDREALRLYGDFFDLVTVEGKLSVTNFQDKIISLEITKTLSGEVKSMQPEAKIEKLARGLRRVNGVSKLIWTIDLQPAEQKQLSYTYTVYIRR